MTGAVRVTTGTLSHGQSHETTLAQIVADRLGLPLGKVKIVQGDTDKITYGFGYLRQPVRNHRWRRGRRRRRQVG